MQRVRLKHLAVVHQAAHLFGRGRQFFCPHDHVYRLGRRQVVADRADAAQTLHDHRQFPVRQALDEALKKAALYLNKKGRICVISFHSLEDKIVKENFRAWAKAGKYRLVVKKILRPTPQEMDDNPRSRSAKMRVIERVR